MSEMAMAIYQQPRDWNPLPASCRYLLMRVSERESAAERYVNWQIGAECSDGESRGVARVRER